MGLEARSKPRVTTYLDLEAKLKEVSRQSTRVADLMAGAKYAVTPESRQNAAEAVRAATRELVEIAEQPVPNPGLNQRDPMARFLTIAELRAQKKLPAR